MVNKTLEDVDIHANVGRKGGMHVPISCRAFLETRSRDVTYLRKMHSSPRRPRAWYCQVNDEDVIGGFPAYFTMRTSVSLY